MIRVGSLFRSRATTTALPDPIVPGGAVTPTSPPTPIGSVFHFSAAGNNGTGDGSTGSPYRDLGAVNLNTLPAGSELRFNRGDTFTMGATRRLYNHNTTATNPLVLTAYGSGARPIFSGQTSYYIFEFGDGFFDSTPTAGYQFRNIDFYGPGPDIAGGASYAFWLKCKVRDVLFEGCRTQNFYTSYDCQGNGEANGDGFHDSRRITWRLNTISNNYGMGINGTVFESLIEGNEYLTPAPSPQVHQIYLSYGDNNTIRVNTMSYSSDNPGGSITAHGFMNNLLVEDNLIDCTTSQPGAYGISISPYGGYDGDGFTNLVVRRNRVKNAGYVAIRVVAAPGCLIEDNVSKLTIADGIQTSVSLEDTEETATQLVGPGTVRDNVHCGYAGGYVVEPAGSTSSNNTIQSGGAANTGVCLWT